MLDQLKFIDFTPLLTIGVLFLVSLVLSTLIIRLGIPKLTDGGPQTNSPTPEHPQLYGLKLPESSSNAVFDLKSTGFWIGACETFLIFVLVFAGAFNALAIIIGAKQFVRSEKIAQNPAYYLLGTLANLSIAIFFGLIASQFWP